MKEKVTILIVEDDAAMRESCVRLFQLEDGYEPVEASTGSEALTLIKERDEIGVVLTDILMPGLSGLELLKQIKLLNHPAEVILMTGYGSIKSAVDAMKYGAADYITKPLDTGELLAAVGRVVELRGLRSEVTRLRSELNDKFSFANMVGRSPGMRAVYDRIEAAAKTGSTVLICGESGTGKELIARAIHYNSSRSSHAFIPVNCAAMPADLIESELFGCVKGAYTGAVRDRAGLFRSADGGTIFLDEILEMPYVSQAKLLRVLQDKLVRPVGGVEETSVDARVIASTNRDVRKAIEEAKFREDLYYRLSVITIYAPPLRSRAEDIPALVDFFIDKLNKNSHRYIKGISREALQKLIDYAWPGNVRELSSIIEGVFAMSGPETIQVDDLPQHVRAPDQSKLPGAYNPSRISTIKEAERELLVRALRESRGNKSRAARILGTSRPRLYKMMEKYNVTGRIS